MTISERRERERLDRENPWRPISQAKPDGSICELRRKDMSDFGRSRFFLHDDGHWYRIDPPRREYRGEIMEFRPVGMTLTAHRRFKVVDEAENGGKFEFRGGEYLPKPKRYKLYWRAED